MRFTGRDRGSFGMDCRFCEGPHSACELAQRDWLNRYNEGDDVGICQWAPEGPLDRIVPKFKFYFGVGFFELQILHNGFEWHPSSSQSDAFCSLSSVDKAVEARQRERQRRLDRRLQCAAGLRIGTISPPTSAVAQNFAQASASARRFSK